MSMQGRLPLSNSKVIHLPTKKILDRTLPHIHPGFFQKWLWCIKRSKVKVGGVEKKKKKDTLLPRVCLLLSWLERVFPDLKLSALKVCVKAVVKSRPFDGPGFPSSKPLWSPHQMYKPSAPHIWNWAVFVECFTLMCVTAHSSWEDWKMWFGNVWQGLQECWGKREMTYCMWVCTCVCIKTQLVEGFVYVPKWGIQYNVRDVVFYLLYLGLRNPAATT